MLDSLQLGQALNLLNGLRPVWAGDQGVWPFEPVEKTPFLLLDTKLSLEVPARWEAPVMTLHESIGGVLNALFAYRMLPFPGDADRFDLPPESLLHSDSDSSLMKILGFSDSAVRQTKGGYVLFCARRRDGEVLHDVQRGGIGKVIRLKNYWTLEGRKAMCRLRVSRRFGTGNHRDGFAELADCDRYIRYFSDFGTHFVSRIEYGDLIYQVYQCRPEKWPEFCRIYERESGGNSLRWPMVGGFSTMLDSSWMLRRGRVRCASGDASLSADIESGIWGRDASCGESILAPFLMDSVSASRFMQRYRKSTIIEMDFAPQCPFMGVFRAAACRRILKGAMLHVFGDGLHYQPVKNAFDRDFAHLWGRHGGASASAEVGRDECRFHLGCSVDALAGSSAFASTKVLCGRLCVQQEAKVPKLVVDRASGSRCAIYAAEMRGALFLTNSSGAHTETFFDGYGYEWGPDVGGASRSLCVSCDIRVMGSADVLPMLGGIVGGIYATEALLRARLTERGAAILYASRWLSWVEDIMVPLVELSALRERVHSLLAVTGNPQCDFPAETCDGAGIVEGVLFMRDMLQAFLKDASAGPGRPPESVISARYEALGTALALILGEAAEGLFGSLPLEYAKSAAPFYPFIQKWRVYAQLLRVWNIVDAELRTRGVDLAPLRTIDGVEIVLTLLARVSILERYLNEDRPHDAVCVRRKARVT